ncbi:MAG: hypothetical protein J6X81_06730 [Muribaculaceae bacterium]|nr:hypothetical protein [Muribaculaceae bacterium]
MTGFIRRLVPSGRQTGFQTINCRPDGAMPFIALVAGLPLAGSLHRLPMPSPARRASTAARVKFAKGDGA